MDRPELLLEFLAEALFLMHMLLQPVTLTTQLVPLPGKGLTLTAQLVPLPGNGLALTTLLVPLPGKGCTLRFRLLKAPLQRDRRFPQGDGTQILGGGELLLSAVWFIAGVLG